MSNYQAGDKFVIEIKEICGCKEINVLAEPHTLYRAKGFNTLTFDEPGLDKLEKVKEPNPIHVAQTQECLMAQYDRGLNDAWELAKKLFGYSCDTKLSCEEMKKIFGSACEMDILRNNTPQEALAKLEAYEKEQAEIKVGDVVELESEKMVVTRIVGNDTMDVLASDGNVYCYSNMPFIKTGKHIDISAILTEIGKE